jgi:hypothetical protein
MALPGAPSEFGYFHGIHVPGAWIRVSGDAQNHYVSAIFIRQPRSLRESRISARKSLPVGSVTEMFFVSERIHFGVDDRICPISALDIATEIEVADETVQVGGLEAEAGGGLGHVPLGPGHGGKDQPLFRLLHHLVKTSEADF